VDCQPIREEEAETVEKAIAYLVAHGMEGLADAPEEYVRGRVLFEALLKRSWDLRHEDPGQMVCLARWATVVASSLKPPDHTAEEAADFRCRAWATLGNAYRVADDLFAAERAMGHATVYYRQGTRSDDLAAWFLDLQASLYGDLRRFEMASEVLNAVHTIHRRRGDNHLAGRALINRGLYAGYDNRPEEALRLTREGVAMIDPEREPVLHFAAVQNEARALKNVGRLREARAVLWTNLQFQGTAGGRLNLLKLRWLEAEINVALGEFDRAERSFLLVRAGFREAKLPYKEAIVSLDLAALWLSQCRTSEARVLACEAAKVFLGLGIHQEALVSIEILLNCFETERVTERLIRCVADYLRESERDKTKRFTPVF
jgi:hypothetical protein